MSQLIIDLEITTDSTGPLATLEEFLAAEKKPTGVFIDAHDDIEIIKPFAPTLSVIALNFPAFSDGRSYSSANLLRREYGYKAELRAVGDVRIDQLEQMTRCGFNAFQLADGQNVEQGLEKLKGFSFSYQPAFNRDPLFRQRSS